MSANKLTEFMAKTKLITGSGCVKQLKDEVNNREYNTMLIVTDKGIRNSGILEKIETILQSTSIETLIYDEVKPNPTVTATNEAYILFKDKGIKSILAVGGGSVIDSAKALAVLFANGGSIADYFGFDIYGNDPIPLFAIPTTVGTGSEGGHAAVITEDHVELKTKKLVFGETLFPKVAFLDGELLQGMPGSLVASTGMDALTHAIEGYVSRNGSVITDALNLHAVRVIGASILEAVGNTENVEAMNKMVQASCSTGIGMANGGLGLVHGISHAIGAQYDAPHGIVNAILLPYVLEFNWIADPYKFAQIGEALRVNTWGMTVEDAAKAAVEKVKELTREVGIPDKLSAIGVDKQNIDVLTDIACKDELYMIPNPRKATRQDIYNILESAI
ncbi:alcohol dehydrogenase [Bacillus thermophilus]|uniref:Alcohol dehydrogenase n=1 Tax=Siminovitchia thermophila TaxID=1245522 RepID=A0ABS2R505_9BACI|nr:iron-containing alcohol dehydrogenase [Siminovitchia thermophila]MBM7714689.1 alcohol dehydrogenase [Siminovitchia thermophila]ONK24527.1 1,3-propanediol dehydrogenase [Bacillus sp. VT-16-64]